MGIHNPTDADSAKFEQLWNDYRTEYESKKIDLLGEVTYQEYPAYMNRYSIEKRVEDFSGLFDSDEQLTDTQREKLVKALLEAQETYTAETADEIGECLVFGSDYYDGGTITRLIELSNKRNEAYFEAARGILSVSQTKKTETYLNQRLERMVSVWNMGALDNGYDTFDLEGDTESQ